MPQTAVLSQDTNASDELKLKLAFAQILANNTGVEITRVLKNPVFLQTNIKAGIKRSYFEKIETKYIAQSSQYKFWFHLLMKEKFIRKVISQAHLSLLPANKQQIMVWMAKEIKDEGQNQDILSYGFDDEVAKYWLEHWAKSYGVKLKYPDLNEEDKLQISPQAIKNLAYKVVNHSKNSYKQDHTMMLFIKQTEQYLKVRTGLVVKNTDVDINYVQDSIEKVEEVYFSIMHDLSQKFASAYKIPASSLQKQTVHFVIKNLKSYDDVLKVKNYLDELSIIDSLSILTASSQKLVLNVELIVNTSTLLNIINADDILQVDDNGAINKLEFYLKPNS